MVDQLDKTNRPAEYWRVQSTDQAHKDKEGKDQEQGRDAYEALHDKTDWKLLMDKKEVWKQNVQVRRDEIGEVVFRKMNIKTDPSLLRVDIVLKGGETISPAFFAVSRITALKFKNLDPGDVIPLESILTGNVLRITVPADPALFKEMEKHSGAPEPVRKKTAADEESTKTEIERRLPFNLKTLQWPAIKDPTGNIRYESIAIYSVVLLIIVFIIGGIVILI